MIVVFDTDVLIPMILNRAECMADLDRLGIP